MCYLVDIGVFSAATKTALFATGVARKALHVCSPVCEKLAPRNLSPLEALLPRPGRREIYLRDIVSVKYSYLCKPLPDLLLRTRVLYRSLHSLTYSACSLEDSSSVRIVLLSRNPYPERHMGLSR